MGEYDVNFNYYETIATLRESCKFMPLELQLIWLLEILLLSAYMGNRSKVRRFNYKGQHIYSFNDLRRASKKITGIEPNTLRLLIKFRNTYVHEGWLSAKDMYETLIYPERHNLIKIADAAKVDINFNYSLYATFN